MDLERRLRRLEWWNRALMLGGVALLVYGGTTHTVPAKAKTEKLVRAERVEIVDSQGQSVAVLGVDEQGSAGLFLNDPGGGVRVALAHDANGSALFLRDNEGVIRVGVAQFAHGGGGVALHGPGSRGAAVLYYKDGGSLTFYDPEGEPTLRFPGEEPEE